MRCFKVEHKIFDLEGGRIVYAVVSHGGVLGVDKKSFAIPWSAFRLDTESHSFILDVDKEVLKNAEGFDKDNWSNTTDSTWGQRTHHEYNGTTPY